MPTKKKTHFPIFHQISRLVTGGLFATLLYYIASEYATTDCQTTQLNILQGGPDVAIKLFLALLLLASIGVPAAVIGVIAGILTGPFVGAPFASLTVVCSSLVLSSLGRLFAYTGHLPSSIHDRWQSSPWFQSMMKDRAASGLNWTALHGLTTPLPYSYFSFIVATAVPHLSLLSLTAGVFVGSVLYIAGYTLAGASIGCAVINHAIGVPFDQYRTLTVVSCLILLLLSKLQFSLQERSQA